MHVVAFDVRSDLASGWLTDGGFKILLHRNEPINLGKKMWWVATVGVVCAIADKANLNFYSVKSFLKKIQSSQDTELHNTERALKKCWEGLMRRQKFKLATS